MTPGSVVVPPYVGVAPLNFIYACSICCYSFADVYEGRNETVKGFSDGINPKDRVVTHLYLASCCHVFCDSHLEGGGPTFHPAGQRPKAPCPMCIHEKGDNEARDLYSIRGFQKEEYDPMIPSAWFTTPPISFEGNDKGIEALRFQYLALTRYCQNTHATRKPLQDALVEADKKLASVQDMASEVHAKVLTLQQENKRLKAEAESMRGSKQELEQYRQLHVNPKDLETFRANKDAIRHYLKLVPMLAKQNEKMKNRLASLGFAMALEPIPNFPGLVPHDTVHDTAVDCDHYGDSSASMRKTTSSHIADRSVHISRDPVTAPFSSFIHRPTKRQRVDSPLPSNMHTESPTIRDAMSPSKKPVSRMRSVRNKIFPTLLNTFSSGHSTPAPEGPYSTSDDVAMYEDEHWYNSTQLPESYSHSGTQQDYRKSAPYMSGALPVECFAHASASRGPQLLSSIDIEGERPEAPFRASSPVKLSQQSSNQQPVQLPIEKSYIRLIDGLSVDSEIELGLKDPRDSRPSACQLAQGNFYDEIGRRHEELDGQRKWRIGHLSHHHTSDGPYLPAGAHLDSPHFARTDNYLKKASQPQTLHPITPATRKHQQSSHQIESVVSPYTDNNSHVLSRSSNNRIAEPQDSSNRSIAYRSAGPQMIELESRWWEPRGLNGLSFFESPVISRRQHARPNHQKQQIDYPPQPRHYQSSNVNTSGFITRAEAGHIPFFRDSAYGSSQERPTYSRQQKVQPKVTIPFPSSSRPSYPRAGQAPPTMQSIISGRSLLRPQPQWQELQRTGVRSSRHGFSSITRNIDASPTEHIPPIAGRRTVRR